MQEGLLTGACASRPRRGLSGPILSRPVACAILVNSFQASVYLRNCSDIKPTWTWFAPGAVAPRVEILGDLICGCGRCPSMSVLRCRHRRPTDSGRPLGRSRENVVLTQTTSCASSRFCHGYIARMPNNRAPPWGNDPYRNRQPRSGRTSAASVQPLPPRLRDRLVSPSQWASPF